MKEIIIYVIGMALSLVLVAITGGLSTAVGAGLFLIGAIAFVVFTVELINETWPRHRSVFKVIETMETPCAYDRDRLQLLDACHLVKVSPHVPEYPNKWLPMPSGKIATIGEHVKIEHGSMMLPRILSLSDWF